MKQQMKIPARQVLTRMVRAMTFMKVKREGNPVLAGSA